MHFTGFEAVDRNLKDLIFSEIASNETFLHYALLGLFPHFNHNPVSGSRLDCSSKVAVHAVFVS